MSYYIQDSEMIVLGKTDLLFDPIVKNIMNIDLSLSVIPSKYYPKS